VLAFVWHDIVRVRATPKDLHAKTCFFFCLADSARLNGFTKLEMAARQGPCSCAVRALSPAQKDLPLAENDDTYAHARDGSLVFCFHEAVRCTQVLFCGA
jgi:hypothetical protein